MFSGPKKPYTAVTVQIERLTSEQYEIDDPSGIFDLVEVVRLQGSGPGEASRALRKKLKYGNLHRQLRALTILDFLIQNAGDRFLREFADEPLLERLRIAATDSVSDAEVKTKCKQLFAQWATTYQGTPGMERITALYQQMPKRKQPARQAQAKVIRDTEPGHNRMGHSVSISAGTGPSTHLTGPSSAKSPPLRPSSATGFLSSKKTKKDKRRSKPFDMAAEKSDMLNTIASASVASTNLTNALKLVNRESRRVSEDPEVMNRFELCRQLRRQVLRFIQHVESEEFLGGLIHANEELVNALMAFEVLDKSVDYDSDSEEDELNNDFSARHLRGNVEEGFAGLVMGSQKPPRPARPTSLSFIPQTASPANDSDNESLESASSEEDDDNPFGDRNAVPSPSIEKTGMSWKEV